MRISDKIEKNTILQNHAKDACNNSPFLIFPRREISTTPPPLPLIPLPNK